MLQAHYLCCSSMSCCLEAQHRLTDFSPPSLVSPRQSLRPSSLQFTKRDFCVSSINRYHWSEITTAPSPSARTWLFLTHSREQYASQFTVIIKRVEKDSRFACASRHTQNQVMFIFSRHWRIAMDTTIPPDTTAPLIARVVEFTSGLARHVAVAWVRTGLKVAILCAQVIFTI